MQLRDYQQRASNSAVKFAFEGKQKNGLVLMPTGTGKSLVIADIVKQIKTYYPPARILMLTHVKELVEQNYEKAASLTPFEIGLWSAGLRKKQFNADIVFAGIDTVARNPDLLGQRHVIIIDEAHRVSHRPNTNYRNVTESLYKFNPNMRSIGLTATGYRMGQGMLTENWWNVRTQSYFAAYWQTILEDMTSMEEFNWFFDQGYLKRIIPKPTDAEIDVSNMRISGEEYVQKDVEAQVNNANKIRAIVDELCENGFDRRSWMVFSAGNYNGKLLTDEIASRGVSVALVTDDTPSAERARIIAAFKRYEIRCIVNNGILTTGFDHNGVDLIGVVRVTNSTPLWVQILGRGTRPVYAEGFDLQTQAGRLSAIFASGVYNCLVLDFAGNAKRLGAINAPLIPEPPDRRKRTMKGESPVKICQSCGLYNPTMVSKCEHCGAEFLLSESITTQASTAQLIVSEHVADIRKMQVTSVYFNLHKTLLPNGTEVSSVYARYHFPRGQGHFDERLSFAGDGSTVATKKWWQIFGNGAPIPESNKQFIDFYSTTIKRPCMIELYMNKPKKARPVVTYYGFSDNTYADLSGELNETEPA